MSVVDDRIRQDNVRLRAKYLSETHCYTSADIRKLAPCDSSDDQGYAEVWKKLNNIFSVNSDGIDVFPSFQFQDGKPKEIIGLLLSQMPENMSDWQIAFWLASGNGYLEGNQAPQDCLDQNDDLALAIKALSSEMYW
jgi:hypothetical protein